MLPQKPISKLNFELLTGTFVYGFSGFFAAALSFLLLPVLTRYLSPYDYGIIETFITVVTLLTGVIIAGENTLLTKEYFNLDVHGRKNYVENALGFVTLTGAFIMILFLILSAVSNILPSILKISNSLILWVIIVSFSAAVISILLTLFQVERKFKLFSMFVNVQILCDVGISLFLIIVVKMQWEGRITGMVASNLVFLALALLIFRKRNVTIRFPKNYAKAIFIIAPPFVLAHTSGWINEMVNKIMINNIQGIDATGIYSIGYRFGVIILLIQEAFGKVWFPFFYENIKENSELHNRMIVKNTYRYFAALIIFSLIYGFFGNRLLHMFVDKRFFAAGQFVFLISMGYCLYGVWKVFIGYLIYKGKIKTYSNIVIFVALTNIALNYFLLKKIGLIGAAWATFISFAIGAILTMFFAVRSHRMPWALSKKT